MGKLLKGVVKFTVAAAAVGGVCYAFRDQIKGSKVYQDNNLDEKFKKVANAIKEKLPTTDVNEEDIVEDDEIFFEDAIAAETSRDYVSINNDAATETEEAAKNEEASEDKETSEAEEAAMDDDEVPTIHV